MPTPPDPSVARRHDHSLEQARRVALDALDALGPVRRRDGQLFAGTTALHGNDALVDHVQATTGYGCSVFDGAVRIATSAVAAGQTERALGTRANEDIARSVYRLGTSFRGIAHTIGKDWLIAYDPLPDVEGRIVGMVAVYRELVDFFDQLQAVHSPEPVIRIDPSGVVVDHNVAARHFCRSRSGSLRGRPVATWLTADLPATVDGHVTLEGTWAQPDGFRFPVSVQLQPVGDDRVLVLRDFTSEARARAEVVALNVELEAARIEAEQASEGKSFFLASVSHELRTPLTAILGYTELLLEDMTGAPADDLGKVQRSARYLLKLIDDLLDLTKAQAGRLQVRDDAVALDAVVEALASEAQTLARANNNDLHWHIAEGCPEVRGDPMRVRQVLLNLLSNAARFTHAGHIRVRATPRGPGGPVDVEVEDTGAGMSDTQVGALFQPFSQVHRPTASLGGTGLGLALSRRLARAMGGDLTVRSRPGHGSTFTLTLPRSEGS